jgi:predicted CopG family antitoxin
LFLKRRRNIKRYLAIPLVTTVTLTAYYRGETEKHIYPGTIRCIMMEKKDMVGIKITWETREKLKAIGMKGDRYEDIICDLLERKERDRELKDAYEKRREPEEEGKIITEFPTPEASGEVEDKE